MSTDAKIIEAISKYEIPELLDMIEKSQGVYMRTRMDESLKKFATSFMETMLGWVKSLHIPTKDDLDGLEIKNERFGSHWVDLVNNLEGERSASTKQEREHFNQQVQKTLLNMIRVME